jgi:hypothetical protein
LNDVVSALLSRAFSWRIAAALVPDARPLGERGASAEQTRDGATRFVSGAQEGSIMRLERSVLALALGAALLEGPARAAAPPRHDGAPRQSRAPRAAVTLTEVASGVEPGATLLGDVKALLREDTEALLATIDWSPLRLRRRYALTASLVRLSTTRTGERSLAASCAVSAAVRDAESGVLLFIIEGRARAEDSDAAGARAERDALRAAVRGAVAAVPEALRKTQ